MKTISIFLALVNLLMAGLILAFTLSPSELAQTERWWSLVKISAALCVILIGVLTWLGSTGSLNPGLIALCSMFLTGLGAATIVWTFHLASISGDMEFYMVLYGGSLIIQGIASLFGFAGDSRDITSV